MEENRATGDTDIDKLSDALDIVLEDQKLEAEAGCVASEALLFKLTLHCIHNS